MAIINGYCALSELKTYIGLSGSGQDDNLENAINGASREIDAFTGRFFYQESATDKYFTPISQYEIDVPDISTTTSLVVKTDTTDNGTHDTTLTINTDFVTKPFDAGNEVNGLQYQPITNITILDRRSSERFEPSIVKNIKTTAKWGFSTVPKAITQATFLQATRLFKRKDSPFAVYGNEQTGTGELFSRFDPDALKLIKKYTLRKL